MRARKLQTAVADLNHQAAVIKGKTMASTVPNDNIFPNEKSPKFPRSEADATKARREQKCDGPLPLQREVPPPQPFPFEALGPVLASAARRCYEVIQAPDAICGQSFLAAASLAVQAHANIEIDGRYHPLSLFCMSVAESGDRKSAVDAVALSPIRDHEKELVNLYEKDCSKYDIDLSVWKAKTEKIAKDKSKKPNEGSCSDAPSDLSNAKPESPLLPNLMVDEPTFEGLFHLLKHGHPALGLFSDEGGRMIGGHGMNSDNLLKTCCGLSILWGGDKPLPSCRRGDGTSVLYGRRLACHLMLQEVVLEKILSNDIFNQQGFVARFLIAFPASTAGNRPYREVDLSADPSLAAYRLRMSSILDESLPLAEGKRNELKSRGLHLSSAAKTRWISFHDEIDSKLKRDGEFFPIRRMANKAAEQVLRIAGTITLFEDIRATQIPLKKIESAIDLIRFYISEAFRIMDMSFADNNLRTAQKVLNWLKKNAEKDPDRLFRLQDIYQGGGTREVRKKSEAERIMSILEDHRQVERLDSKVKEWRLKWLNG